MTNFIKKIIGIREFKTPEEIIVELKEKDSSQDFSKAKHVLIAESNSVKLWLITSRTHVFIVKDDGFELTRIPKKGNPILRLK